MRKIAWIVLIIAAVAGSGCSREHKAAQQVQTAVEKSLDQAGFGSDLKVDIDHNKKVVTLDGAVRSMELKHKAGGVATAAAPGYVVANQLGVEPVDGEEKAREIQANLDEGIENNYKALLTANKLDDSGVQFSVKNGVLTLEGTVKDPETRAAADRLGASVPYVSQVINKLDVKR